MTDTNRQVETGLDGDRGYEAEGSPRYERSTSPRNSTASQRPLRVARVRSAAEAARAVRYAIDRGLRVLPQATGHGASGQIGNETLLVDTAELDSVSIAAPGVARIGAGATWQRVNAAAEPHGLLGPSGTSASVGVSGYTFGGGVGWLTRAHGLASGSLRSVSYLDGTGSLRIASDDADEAVDREAIWAFRGAGGVGLALELEIDLAEVPDLWAGYALWPIDDLDSVVASWGEALTGLGSAVTTSIAVLHAPPAPPISEGLRGRPLVHLAMASPNGEGDARVLREAIAGGPAPWVDTWGPSSADRLADIHLDPPNAVPAWGDGRWMGAGTPGRAADLLRVAVGERPGLAMIEIRNVDTSVAGRPGAITAPPAPFLLHAVGPGPTVEARTAVEAALGELRRLAAPVDAGRSAPSFAEGRRGDADALTTGARKRLAAVWSAVDPASVFHRSRFMSGVGRGIPPA